MVELDDDELNAALTQIGQSVLEHGSIDPNDLSSEDASLLYTIAHNFYEVGDYEQAEPLFRRLVTACPLVPRNWFGVAACSQQLKKYEEATVAWNMLALLSPNPLTPLIHSAECLISLGRIDEAKKSLAEASKLAEDDTHEMEQIQALHIAIERGEGHGRS